MRLRHALATGITVATTTIAPMTAHALPAPVQAVQAVQAVSLLAPVPAVSLVAPGTRAVSVPVAAGPRCGKLSDPEFPITSRILGGPDAYRPGGAAGTWALELTNTTARMCRDIHPVLVLVDRHRALTASQLTLEMTDGEGRWHALPLEKTERDEIIGVLDDGSPGFAVPAGHTVTVHARLAFAANTEPNKVMITAAAVQRRGRDGDWVGESDAYRLAVRKPEGKGISGDGSTKGTGTRTPAPAVGHSHPGERLPGTGQLARAGLEGDLVGRTAAVAALLIGGALLVVGARRLRTDPTERH
ncbi:hypothetical protein KQY30_23155 [Streptomyces sp. GMY02]|uniref:hypothetical protein n=1 Tax=Streptomyces sp. GMY02 TaxID=1333528 RepID=UPI001C2C3656|nr:hypothetical protein [Streptomyces sp. GMY02]QXE36682.1 hypothetical protein KQY30_23155 [Streptomyces sp. GMY02]